MVSATLKSGNGADCTLDETRGGSLSGLPLFSQARAEFIRKLQDQGHTNRYDKNHVIFMQDDLAEWFYLVREGWVKLYRQTLDGNDVILDIVPAGALFGEACIFGGDTYTYGAEIVQDAKITAYPLSLLKAEVEANPAFSIAMIRHLASAQVERDKEIEHRTVQNAAQRLGCFLLRLIRTDKGGNGPITLHLPYDKTLIASRLGMKPETFSRALARLRDDLNLEIAGASITVSSLDELIRYSCVACSNAFPCDE